MARKTKEEALRTRQLLIESAIQQFALPGVTNTTLTDIADAAGVTRGAVYWHFASKTELFNEMWQQQPPLRDLIQHSLATENEQEPLNALRERFITGLRYIAANPRQRALMQILYQRCEFANDMLSENEIRQRIADVESEQKQRVGKRGKLAEYLETLKNQGIISSFNETLWYGTVEQVRVLKDGKLRFIFKDGSMVDC